jgi:isopenicillin-N N-acyltransferase-like protein
MALPLIELSGSPYDQGVDHGRLARARIGQNLATYCRRFHEGVGLPAAEVLRRAAATGPRQ